MEFVALSSDTDCDGTLFCIRAIEAESKEDAWTKVGDYYCTSEILSWEEYLASDVFKNLSVRDAEYFAEAGYASIGANWNPWIYDDTIGIPALDSTYDEPLKGW